MQNEKLAVMKVFKNLDRWLLVVGVGLLAFCGAAKLREVVLSRAAVRQFEFLRQPAINSAVGAAVAHPTISRPDFLLWSEQRVRQYDEGLTQHPRLHWRCCASTEFMSRRLCSRVQTI